ncbi:hypothetical protein VNO80_29621 [Phaseolus coccineus]|uniref:Uncharacterized protein n=1 Tax=Phaseolus coccineus TaxID=3886 RepID=A0AAN9LB88_PHACN
MISVLAHIVVLYHNLSHVGSYPPPDVPATHHTLNIYHQNLIPNTALSFDSPPNISNTVFRFLKPNQTHLCSDIN